MYAIVACHYSILQEQALKSRDMLIVRSSELALYACNLEAAWMSR